LVFRFGSGDAPTDGPRMPHGPDDRPPGALSLDGSECAEYADGEQTGARHRVCAAA
jgi:hypothetical protein